MKPTNDPCFFNKPDFFSRTVFTIDDFHTPIHLIGLFSPLGVTILLFFLFFFGGGFDQSMAFTYGSSSRVQTGPPQYRSRTIYEDATPEALRDFFWDDEFRMEAKWDDMLIYHKTLEECQKTGTMVVHWVRKVGSLEKTADFCRLMIPRSVLVVLTSFTPVASFRSSAAIVST